MSWTVCFSKEKEEKEAPKLEELAVGMGQKQALKKVLKYQHQDIPAISLTKTHADVLLVAETHSMNSLCKLLVTEYLNANQKIEQQWH